MRNASTALKIRSAAIAPENQTRRERAVPSVRLVQVTDRTRTAFAPTPAMPDVPPAIGFMVLASYTALFLTFLIGLAATREMIVNLGIIAIFLIMFFVIPRIFLGVEPDGPARPTLARFMRQGIETATGHCAGRDALIQILIVPVFLTACAAVMGIVATIVF